VDISLGRMHVITDDTLAIDIQSDDFDQDIRTMQGDK
jgi:hypothetical protein